MLGKYERLRLQRWWRNHLLDVVMFAGIAVSLLGVAVVLLA